jgi:branched-chain amino acid transport system permease protein
MSWMMFWQNLVNGISLGSLYALLAIGYTMVYGILRLINFAHGDIFMLGGYYLFYGILIFRLPWWVAFILAVVLTALTGVIVERVAYRPLRQAPKISALISAIGVSFFLENVGLVAFGGRPKPFEQPEIFSQVWQIGGVAVMSINLYITLIAVLFLFLLIYIVYRTKAGLAMRAISVDQEAARLMAIDVDRTISLTFAIGSALAAVGGILWALKYPQLNPLMGVLPGLKAFIAAVLGGIGSIPGAMLGGFILGIGEIMLVAALPELSGYRDAMAFLVLIMIFLIRPGGILGDSTREKV